MNKRLLNIVLIIAVVVIWMTAILRYLNSSSQEEPLFVAEEAISEITTKIKRESFTLLPEYRDPFLGNDIPGTSSMKTTANTGNNQRKEQKKPEPVKTETPWPQIRFIGIIKNVSADKTVALVNINGKEKRLRAGEMVDDMKVDKIYKDSLLVSRGKDLKMVRR